MTPPNWFACMDIALAEAQEAFSRGEVPVGAVVTNPKGLLLAKASNRTIQYADPTAHAEILAIRKVCQLLNTPRLTGYRLYVTKEPCPLCAAAFLEARMTHLYYGACDEKGGGVDHNIQLFTSMKKNHKINVYRGIREDESLQLLKAFFQSKR